MLTIKYFCYFISKFLGRATKDGAMYQKNKRSTKVWMWRGTMCTAELVRWAWGDGVAAGRRRARSLCLRGSAMPPACAGVYVVESFLFFVIHGAGFC